MKRKLTEKEWMELTPFEKQILWDNVELRQAIHIMIKHLEIINGIREKKSLSTQSTSKMQGVKSMNRDNDEFKFS